jgi:hypothetical protein
VVRIGGELRLRESIGPTWIPFEAQMRGDRNGLAEMGHFGRWFAPTATARKKRDVAGFTHNCRTNEASGTRVVCQSTPS